MVSNRNARIAAVLSGHLFPLVLAALVAAGLVVALASGRFIGDGSTADMDSLPSRQPKWLTSSSSSRLDLHRRPRDCLGWDLSRGRWSTGSRVCVRSPHAVAGCNDYLRPRVAAAAHHGYAAAPTLTTLVERHRELDPVAARSVRVRAWEFAPDVRDRCRVVRVDWSTLSAPAMFGGRNKHVAVVGDSVVRHLYAALLRAAAEDPDRWHMRSEQKHRDWSHRLVGGGRATFTWAPYVHNITDVLTAWSSSDDEDEDDEEEAAAASPDAVVKTTRVVSLRMAAVDRCRRCRRGQEGDNLEEQELLDGGSPRRTAAGAMTRGTHAAADMFRFVRAACLLRGRGEERGRVSLLSAFFRQRRGKREEAVSFYQNIYYRKGKKNVIYCLQVRIYYMILYLRR